MNIDRYVDLWFILPLLTTMYLGDNPITTIRNNKYHRINKSVKDII